MATSGHYHDSLREITDEWGLADVYDALAVIEELDDAEARARAPAG